MAMISMGAFDAARKLAGHNIPLLAEAVRQGYRDCDQSSLRRALCLTREYLHLVDDDEARLVAANTTKRAVTFGKCTKRDGLSWISSR